MTTPSWPPTHSATTPSPTPTTPRAAGAPRRPHPPANPRDSLEDTIADVKRHRIVRRGMRYGPELPDGVGDDGVDRGSAPRRTPLIGANDGTGTFTIPHKPLRRRVKGLPRLVTTRAGEDCFIPGIRALQWIAEGQ